MRSFLMSVTTLIHGLFTTMVLLVLADVWSPTFNIEEIPAWTGGQAVAVFVVVLTVSFALGIVMHTISRGLLHKQKQQWTLDVLASGAMENRLSSVSKIYPSPGGPSYAELWDEEEKDKHNRAWRASMFMQGIEYQIMLRAPHVFETIQVYREQYRMARGFILPLAVLAFTLPFWAPVIALDAGSIGPFPIIRSQVFMVSLLASAVTFQSFRERAYRYAAAKALAWVTLEGVEARGRSLTSVS